MRTELEQRLRRESDPNTFYDFDQIDGSSFQTENTVQTWSPATSNGEFFREKQPSFRKHDTFMNLPIPKKTKKGGLSSMLKKEPSPREILLDSQQGARGSFEDETGAIPESPSESTSIIPTMEVSARRVLRQPSGAPEKQIEYQVYVPQKPDDDEPQGYTVYLNPYSNTMDLIKFLNEAFPGKALSGRILGIWVADEDGEKDDDFPRLENDGVLKEMGIASFFVDLRFDTGARPSNSDVKNVQHEHGYSSHATVGSPQAADYVSSMGTTTNTTSTTIRKPTAMESVSWWCQDYICCCCRQDNVQGGYVRRESGGFEMMQSDGGGVKTALV